MVFLVIPAVLAALVLGGLYYGYRLAFYYVDPKSDPLNYERTEQTKPLEHRFDQAITDLKQVQGEAVSIQTFDGLTLTGQYYHMADGAPLHILFHGYKGNAIRDFAGALPVIQELGHNALLVDQRCHGNSQGHTITFGIREHQDCLCWVQYACQRFGDVPMMLMGVSMGAATVLMASALELPGNVKAVFADCPYDSPAGIIQKVLGTEMGMPVRLVYPLIRLGGILYGRFDLEKFSPLDAISRSRVPIALIHGDDDRFVPYEMSCNLHRRAPKTIEFHTIPGSGHALNQFADPQLYRSILIPFIQKYVI